MTSILFTTNHPAPYIDKQVDILRRNFSVDIVYKKRKDNYKKWIESDAVDSATKNELNNIAENENEEQINQKECTECVKHRTC